MLVYRAWNFVLCIYTYVQKVENSRTIIEIASAHIQYVRLFGACLADTKFGANC